MEVLSIYILMMWNFMLINGETLCNYQLLSWRSAMARCHDIGGVPVSIGVISSVTEIPDDASFWTSDYVTTELHVSVMPENPVSCGYRTRGYYWFGAVVFGDCISEKQYICCQADQLDEQCVRRGTWQDAVSCTDSKYTDMVVNSMFPMGDYWAAQAYASKTNTLSVDVNNLPIPDQCGSVTSNRLRFENNCSLLRYSMCDLPDHSVRSPDYSECGQTKVPTTTKSVSPTDRPTSRAHFTSTMALTRTSRTASMRTPSATLFTTIRTSSRSTSRIQPYKLTSPATLFTTIRTSSRSTSRIQPYKLTSSATLFTTIRTSSRSTTRIQQYITPEQHALIPTRMPDNASFSNSNVSNLNIGLGVGLGGFVVIVVVIGLSCYIRRNMNRRDDKSTASAHAEMNATYGVSENRVTLTLDNPCQIAAHNDTYYSNSAIRHGRNPPGYEETCTDRNFAHVAHQGNHRQGNAISETKKSSTKHEDHLKSGANEQIAEYNVAMNRLYFTSNEQEGLDHEYCNTDIMSDQYDSVHFSEAPDSVTLNEYSHIGFGKQYDHDENDYNVAFSNNEQATPYMSEYGRLK